MTECLKFAENQMANTFFGFNTSLNDHADRLGSSPEDIEGLEAEEEYDALNDETFGALENEGDLDDWEAQHEQLAEIAESSRHSNDIESFLDQLGLNDDDSVVPKDANVWSYNSDLKNGDKLNASSVLDSTIKLLPGIPNNDGKSPGSGALFPGSLGAPGQRSAGMQAQGPKLRTVEELERMLLNQSKPGQQHGGPRFPPGFQPLLLNSGGHQGGPWPPGAPPQAAPGQGVPPGMVRVMGHTGSRVGGPPPPPGFVGYPPQHGQGFPLPPHFAFPPPPRLQNLPPGLLPPRPGHAHPKPHPYPANHTVHPHHRPPPPPHMQHPHLHHQPPPHPHHHYNNNNNHHHQQQQHQQLQQHHQQQQQQHQQHQQQHGGGDTRDEYAGLMNNREKQWLLNIQLLQVNTGTPYFDDYYYTVFKERQAKNKESGGDQRLNQRYHNRGNVRDGNAGHHHHRGGNQNHQQPQEQQNPVKKTYTPLQFENSLGKLQFGSVTAPRKIIDMDIISSSDPDPQVSRDSRKTKQLLLELEALYTLLLRAEDLRNPLAVASQEKLVELRQKQRLREMDAAPTPEQKQEVLRLLQAESLTPLDTPLELLSRLLASLLDLSPGSSDRLASFLAVRKGKLLVLRALPQLASHGAVFHEQLRELWARVLTAIPAVGRRDATGDGVLVRLVPHFNKFINLTEMDEILELVSNLTEIMKLENSRSTPLSHQSKAPLHFILQNKFGITAIASILQRADSLLDDSASKQQSDWSAFLTALVDTLSLVGSVTSPPLEPISDACLARHLDRLGGITADKKLLLEKVFLESNL